jgi:hypothetical protein
MLTELGFAGFEKGSVFASMVQCFWYGIGLHRYGLVLSGMD